MKKLLLTVLCFILFITSCSNNNLKKEGVELNDKIQVECTYDLFDYSVDEEYNIYIADKEEVFMITTTGKKKSIINGLEYCNQIILHNNLIYTLDVINNEKLIVFNKNGDKVDEISIDIDIGLDMKIVDGYMFILHQDKTNHDKRYLTTLNLDNKQTKKLKFDNVRNFCGFTKGKILLSFLSDSHHYIYNYNEDKLFKKDMPDIMYTDIHYESGENVLYYVNNNFINKLDLDSKISKTLYTAKEIRLSNIILVNNYCFSFDHDTNTIHSVKKIINNKSGNITVLSDFDSFDNYLNIKKALEIFHENNNNMSITFQSINRNEYYDDLAVKFMSNSKEFDIFFLSNFNNSHFIKNKVMQDLNIYPKIVDKFDYMFKGIKNNCVSNGELIGIPLFIDINSWLANEHLMEKLDISCPTGTWTWDEFYDLAKDVRQDLDGNGTYDTYACKFNYSFPPFYYQYLSQSLDLVNSKVNFAKDVLIHLLKLWKNLVEEDLVLEMKNPGKNNDNILFTEESLSLMEGNKNLILPPVIEGHEIYPLTIDTLCINKNSLNKDLSAEFLATILSEEVQTAYPESGNTIYNDISLYKQNFENGLFGFMSNDKNYNLYKHMLNKSKKKVFQYDFRKYFVNILDVYLSNKTSAEKAVNLIEEKAKMIVNE